MAKMEAIDWLVIVLLIAGGINWGLVAFGFNAVEYLIGTLFAKIVYFLVGAASLTGCVRLLTRGK
jgi:uncharacterized membrane protein YuzA (DUF378 family)